MKSAAERNNRGIYRCGNCDEIGHTRDTCEKRDRRRVSPLFKGTNAGYQANRAAKICDDCGVPSKRSRCSRCAKRRKRWPSRSPEAMRIYDRNRRGAA